MATAGSAPMTRALAPAVVDIPGGLFRMGSEDGRDDERPIREVEVGAFALGRTPVTRAQYAPFLACGAAEPPPWWDAAEFGDPEQPVVGVTWFEAVAYASWLSAEAGGAWRLPTEVEWERAARGGLDQAPTPWGADVPPRELPDGPLRAPWPVARGTPNGFGLYDMGTIVHEWCADWYAHETLVAREDAPPRRASRGGSWRHRVRWSPPAARSSLPPGFRYADYGFRVLKEAAR